MRTATARHDVLAAALRDLQRALAPLRMALAADDPLRLALPPLPAGGAATPGRDVLSAYAALYLHAELDEAGVLPTVEALAERRHALALQDRVTADRLERFARSARDHLTRSERTVIYARLFGLGPVALRGVQAMALSDSPAWGADDGTRLDFLQRLLRLAAAVVRAELERVRLGGQPGLLSQAAWRAAAQDLLALVSALPAGSLVQWARGIHARTLQAFEVLGDKGLQRQLVSRTPWETLQRLLPEDGAARRDAAARRGAAGQALLRSLATAGDDALPNAEAVQSALRWLVASGLPVPSAMPQLPLAPVQMPNTAFSVAAGASAAPVRATAPAVRRQPAAAAAAASPRRPAQGLMADPLAEDALPEDTWAEAHA